MHNYLVKILFSFDSISFVFKSATKLNLILKFFKKHSLFQYNILSDICCTDYLNSCLKRYELNFFLLSVRFSTRVIIIININENEVIQSSTNLFSASN